MSDDRETDARPAKRARLDDSAAHTPSAAPTPAQATPGSALNAPSQIETDYEKEVRAGITEYITPDNLGFTGVLKQRYTDFLVNEIGLDGQVLHLKKVGVERKKKEAKTEAEAEVGAEKEAKPEEKMEIREESEVVAAPAEAPAAPEQPVKAEEASANDGEETFSIAAAPKKVVKEEVRLGDTMLALRIEAPLTKRS
jgi:tRNA pseudouridine13 synthase